MLKRGPIIALAGVALIIGAFLVAHSVLPSIEPSISSGGFLSIMEDMFDYVSEDTQIFPGESTSFSFTTSKGEVPLMWGLQIIDYQQGDRVSILVSNIFGDNLRRFETQEPIFFNIFQISEADTYSFTVQNLGSRSIAVFMMISEDPENSEAMLDPDSPILQVMIPLAVSGILLIIGMIILVVGIILIIIDWRKGKSESRYV